MDDEQSARLSQDMFDAKDDAGPLSDEDGGEGEADVGET